MNTSQSLFEELQIIRNTPLVDFVQILDMGRYTFKARLYIQSDLFVQIYRNELYDTTNLVLILGRKRIYGRDALNGEWHRHPMENPALHDTSAEGGKEVNLMAFWQEVEEVLAKLKLVG